MALFYAKIGCFHTYGIDQLQIKQGSNYFGVIIEAENIELAIEKISNVLKPFHSDLEFFVHKSTFKEGVRYSINFNKPGNLHSITDCAQMWDEKIKIIS